MFYEQCIKILGLKAKDKLTGSKGTITNICFDLFGCIQVTISPGKINNDGKEIPAIGWIDINRVKILSKKTVFDHPDYSIKYKTFSENKKTFRQVHGASMKPLKS